MNLATFYKKLKPDNQKWLQTQAVSELTADNMAAIFSEFRSLQFSSEKFKDLEFLQFFPKIEYLEISGCNLKSLEGLAFVPLLQRLEIPYNGLKSLDGLQNCPQLSHLTANNCEIKDASALQFVPKLTHLNLSYNNGIKTEVFEHLPALIDLSLKSAKLKQIDFLAHLPALQELDLGDNTGVKNWESFAALQQLKTLNWERNKGKNLDWLQYCPHLEHLSLDNTNIVDFKGLSFAAQLVKLSVCSTAIANADFLSFCPNLQEVNLDFSPMLDNIQGAKNCPNLQRVRLFHAGVKSLAGLENCVQLIKLQASSCIHLVSITELSLCKNIRDLRLMDLKLDNWEVLANLPHLEFIDVRGANVTKAYIQSIAQQPTITIWGY